jgi:hypothetical protein
VGQPPPGGNDVADGGGLDDQQPGVVGDPVGVVRGPLAGVEALPDLGVEQLRDGGDLAGELPPAGQRGQCPELGIVVRAGLAGHHGLSAPAKGSKIGIGMASASPSPSRLPAGGASFSHGWALSWDAGASAPPWSGPRPAGCGGPASPGSRRQADARARLAGGHADGRHRVGVREGRRTGSSLLRIGSFREKLLSSL